MPRSRLFALVALLTATAAPPALGREDAPRLGTWSLTVGGPGGRAIPVTIVRGAGAEVLGVIEFMPDGPQQTLEVFVARVDPEGRTVRFFGRAVYSRAEGLFPGNYEATLAADGRSMTGFRSVTLASTGVTGSLRWENADVPAYPREVASILDMTGERPLMYWQLSAAYTLDGVAVRPGADRPLLDELARSGDDRARRLSSAKANFLDLHRQSLAEDGKTAEEFARGDRDRRAAMLAFLVSTAAGDDGPPPSAIGDLMESVGLEKAFNRRLAKAQMAAVQIGVMTRFRGELRADYLARGGGKTTLPAGGVVAGFAVKDRRGLVTLRNATGGDLHNVLVATRMTVDQARVDEYARKVKADAALARGLVGPMFGVDFGTLIEAETALVAYHRLEKGVPAFVALWPDGSTLEVEVSMADALRESAAALEAWVGGDEGQAELALDVAAARKAAAAALPPGRGTAAKGLRSPARGRARGR